MFLSLLLDMLLLIISLYGSLDGFVVLASWKNRREKRNRRTRPRKEKNQWISRPQSIQREYQSHVRQIKHANSKKIDWLSSYNRLWKWCVQASSFDRVCIADRFSRSHLPLRQAKSTTKNSLVISRLKQSDNNLSTSLFPPYIYVERHFSPSLRLSLSISAWIATPLLSFDESVLIVSDLVHNQ